MSKKSSNSTLDGVFPDADNEADFLFKIVLVGDSGVGKTNILSKFVRNIFSEDSKTTIGVEFATTKIAVANKTARVQIWDTAGQERYRAITNSYYRNAHAAMIVYDITNSVSYANVIKWLAEIRNNSKPSTVLVLIGNKYDLAQLRSVLESDAKGLAEKEHMLFFETSAKTGDKIKDVFEKVTQTLVEAAEDSNSFGIKQMPKITTPPIGKSLANEPKQQSGCCKDTK